MSKPVQFSTPYSKYQNAVQRFEHRTAKFAGYSSMGFMATVGFGAFGSLVAIATRGKVPTARFFNAWEKTIQVTGVGMVAGGTANAVAEAAIRSSKSPFISKDSETM